MLPLLASMAVYDGGLLPSGSLVVQLRPLKLIVSASAQPGRQAATTTAAARLIRRRPHAVMLVSPFALRILIGLLVDSDWHGRMHNELVYPTCQYKLCQNAS